MANQAYHEIVNQGVQVWNAWREANASIQHPDLSELIYETSICMARIFKGRT